MPVNIFEQQKSPRNIFDAAPRNIFDADLSYMAQPEPSDSVAASFSVLSDEERDEIKKKGKIGMVEAFQRQSKLDLLPFSPSGLIENASVLNAVNRLKANEYGDDISAREKDQKIFADFYRKYEEEQIRGVSWAGQIYRGVSQLPGFMVEFASTGGIASFGRAVARKALGGAVEVAATKGARAIAAKAAVKGAEMAGVAVARTPFMYNIYTPKYAERQIFANIAVTDKGIDILKEGNETPVVSVLKAYGDAFIEVYSESLGGEVFRPVAGAVGSRLGQKISPQAKAGIIRFMNILSAKGRITDLMTKAGFNGILEEIGEEIAGDQLRAAFNIEDFGEEEGNVIDRMSAAVPGWDEIGIMAGIFAIPGSISYSSQKLYNKLRERGASEDQVRNVHENMSETEKEAILADFLAEENTWLGEALKKAIAKEELSSQERFALQNKFKEYVDRGWIEMQVSEKVTPVSFEEKAKAVEAVNEAITAYHGTTAQFEEFSKEKASIESDFGKGIYFSSSIYDVLSNYATEEGPDLINRIEQMAEEIESREGVPIEEARERAKKILSPGKAEMIEVQLDINNPVILGGEKETIFDFHFQYEENDPEKDIIGEEGTLIDFLNALREASEGYNDVDIDRAIGEVMEKSSYESISASELVKILKESEGLIYATNDEGRLASNEIIRAAFENMGFDAIVDNTVDEKFGTSRKVGKAMEGIEPGVTRYIVFNPEQVKRVFRPSRKAIKGIGKAIKEGAREVAAADRERGRASGEAGKPAEAKRERKPVRITRQQKYEAMVARIAEIRKMKVELGEKLDLLKEVFDYLADQRKQYHHKIKRYKDGYLDEEYNALPTYFRGTKGITLDEAASQAGFDSDMAFRDHLIQLENDYHKAKEEYAEMRQRRADETQKQVIQSEISSLKRRVSDYKAGKEEAAKDIHEIQTEVSQVARKLLPRRELGKVLATIKNINKPSDIPEAMEKIQEVYEKFIDRLKRIRAFKEILKEYRQPENVLDVKYQEKIDALVQKLGADKGEKRQALAQMSTEQLIDLAREIALLREEGKTAYATKRELKMMASEIMRAALIKSAGSSVDIENIGSLEEEKRAKKTGFGAGIRQFDLAFERPLRLIREIFGELGERLLYDSLDNAEVMAQHHRIKRLKKINDILRKYKIKLNDIGKAVEIDGVTFQVNNLMTFYAQRNNDEARRAIIFGNNIKEELFEKFIKHLKQNHPNIVQAVDEIKEVVGDRYEEARKVMNETFNVSMPKVADYFPMTRRRLDSQDDPDPLMGLDLIGDAVLKKGSGINYAAVEKGFTITRKDISDRNQKPISIDFMEDAARAIDTQEHFVHYAKIQKIYNNIKSDSSLRNAVIYNHGESAWNALDRYMNEAINPRVYMKGLSFIGRRIRDLRKAVGVFFLGFNIPTVLKQFPAVHFALKYSTLPHIYRSMAKVLTSKQYRESVKKLDPSIEQRVMDRDLAEIMQGIRGLSRNDLLRQLQILEKDITESAMKLIVNADQWTVIAVFDAVYQYQKKRIGHEEAVKMAHKAVLETQAQGRTIDLPEAYRTNDEFQRMLLLFSNQLNQVWNMIRHDLPREMRTDKPQAMLSLASIMLNSLMLYVATHGGEWPDDDEEQWRAWTEATLGGFLSSFPVAGNMAMSGLSGYSTSILPLESIIDNMKYVSAQYADEEYLSATVNLLTDLAVFTGLQIPGNAVRKTLKGIADLKEGETEDLRRLIWSKSALYEED